MQIPTEDGQDKDVSFRPLYWVIGIVVLLWVTNLVALVCVKDRGSFGDMFGTVNSLFSGLAFSGIIFTILLQKNELALQRKELRLTRKVFESQGEELKTQNEWNKRQVFEASFYNLLKTHQDNLASFEVGNYVGRKGFSRLLEIFNNVHSQNLFRLSRINIGNPTREIFEQEYQHILNFIVNIPFGEINSKLKQEIDGEIKKHGFAKALQNAIDENKNDPGWLNTAYSNANGGVKQEICLLQWEVLSKSEKLSLMNTTFNDIYREYGVVTGPYFRFLYNFMRFVHESKIEEKQFYAKILRAHLSRPEIAMLFYNNLSDKGTLKFIRYIDAYDFRKGMYPEDIVFYKNVEELWSERKTKKDSEEIPPPPNNNAGTIT